MSDSAVGVIGGGIVGLAVGRELARRRPGAPVVVFEKEDRLGAHQTGHNSGVVHAGIYYRPGSLKAELCARGREMLRDYCSERGLPYEEWGKLVVAVDPSELGRLDALERIARANRVPALRRVGGGGIAEIEPCAAGLQALHSPATAVTDFAAVARAMGEDIEAAGGAVLLSARVDRISRAAGAIEVATRTGARRVGRLVICAGLQADRVARRVDGRKEPRIVAFRGEYMSVAEAKRDMVRGLIYPVPDPRYPFLGVHFTRRVSGELEVGPNAVLALKREGYGRADFSLADTAQMAAWPGFWRMARAHWRTGLAELRGSWSTQAYMRSAQRYVPGIGADDVSRGRTGVRAQALDRDGSLVDDFRIFSGNGIVSVRNAPSPAATSSLAIAEHIADAMEN